jgi:hypothetical protein
MFGTLRRFTKAIPIPVGAVLFLAAIAKATEPQETIDSISLVAGDAVARALTVWLVCIEVILGSALMARVMPRLTLGIAAALFTAFCGWIAYLWWVDAPVSCGCGLRFPWARAVSGDWPVAMARAAGLLLCSVFGLLSYGFPGPPDKEAGKPLGDRS